MGELITARIPDLPPQKVGTIFAKAGSPHIMRVIGPDNLMQRFSGSRAERRKTLAEWRKVAADQKALAESLADA